jgi:hypothetical protein
VRDRLAGELNTSIALQDNLGRPASASRATVTHLMCRR